MFKLCWWGDKQWVWKWVPYNNQMFNLLYLSRQYILSLRHQGHSLTVSWFKIIDSIILLHSLNLDFLMMETPASIRDHVKWNLRKVLKHILKDSATSTPSNWQDEDHLAIKKKKATTLKPRDKWSLLWFIPSQALNSREEGSTGVRKGKDLDLTDSISLVLKFAGKLSTNFFVHGPYLKLVTRSWGNQDQMTAAK